VTVAATPRKKQVGDDPVTSYARAVLADQRIAGKLVRQACQRHLNDLAEGRFTWDPAAAQRAIDFFGFLTHHKGEWTGQPIVLEPWEEFIIGSLFGWKRADGTRRYRDAYVEVARKNGKTEIASGLGILLAFFDDEGGAEVYAASTKREQSKIVWDEAARMVRASAGLRQRIKVFVGSMFIDGTASKFMPLGADMDTTDGLNVHGAIVDEVHAHKTRGMWDVLRTASGARRQPLRFAITTAGFDRKSLCWELHTFSIAVLNGLEGAAADATFAYVAALDEGDDPFDEKNWPKANPNLGISVKLDELREEAARAKEMPGSRNPFLRLRLNVWTEQANRWANMDAWDACSDAPFFRDGLPRFGGLDLASTRDIAAFLLICPDGEYVDVKAYFWCPAEGIVQRSQRDGVPYDVWADQGLIVKTPGNVTDYDRIRQDVRNIADDIGIGPIGYDRWNASQLVAQLQDDGAEMIPVGQGYASLAMPMKEVEKLMLSGKLRHDGNPVLRWMVSNVQASEDPALLDAVFTWQHVAPEEKFVSVYEQRGIATFGAPL
jgi:phage terminase large subunit-like protein